MAETLEALWRRWPAAGDGALMNELTRLETIHRFLVFSPALAVLWPPALLSAATLVLYSQRVWNQTGVGGRVESVYSTARSESPSEYSRHRWRGSNGSFDDDDDDDDGIIQSRPTSPSPSARTRDQSKENDEDCGAVDATHSKDRESVYLATGESSLQPRLSVMGPKTRHVTRAPWEPGGEDDLEEEPETHESDTRSLFSGRGRSKKPKEKDSKQRAFPASFVPRASSSSRPSVDVSTPTSTSSGGKFRHNLRTESIGTLQSNVSDTVPFPSPRLDKPAAPSLRNAHRNTVDTQSVSSHPYANPDVSSYGDSPKASYPSSPKYPPASPRISKPIAFEHVTHGGSPGPIPTRDSFQNGPLQKMAPWQYTPGSPTFQLVSLEEAQALKARQKQMSVGSNGPAAPRLRTTSGPSHSSIHPLEHTSSGSVEDANTSSKTLKGRRSLMGLFARGKEKDRSPTMGTESPPPVPSLPTLVATNPSSPAPPSTSATPTVETPVPHRQGSVPSLRPPKRAPPPSLNVVVTSPSQPLTAPENHNTTAPHPISAIQNSTTPPPSMPLGNTPSKKSSFSALSPTEVPSQAKPTSAPSNVQGFSGLSLRPMSTIFNSLPADYLSNTTPAPLAPSCMSASSSGQFSTQSPTTPSLWSSRSESISTGSSEVPPITPGGLLQAANSGSSAEGVASLSILQKQAYSTKEVWKTQIADLEAQVRALKAEVAELRKCPCPSCGYLGGGSSGAEKVSVVHRPRAKAVAGASRTLFGNAD